LNYRAVKEKGRRFNTLRPFEKNMIGLIIKMRECKCETSNPGDSSAYGDLRGDMIRKHNDLLLEIDRKIDSNGYFSY